MKKKSNKMYFSLICLVLLLCAGLSTVQADVVEFNLLQDKSALNMYPGTDGLIGTVDDQLSDDFSPANKSDPNVNGAYSYFAFDFGSGVTDAPLLPTGYNAIAFLEGVFSADPDKFTMGGPNFTDMAVTGTVPFQGHLAYVFQITKMNSYTYDKATGAFTSDVEFRTDLGGGSTTATMPDFSGESWIVDSAEFDTFDSNAYVRDVLIPLAKTTGASKLLYMSGSGIVPASVCCTPGSFGQMPVKGVFVAIYKAGEWLVNDFNGDKRTDLPWRNQANGQNRLWLMNGPVREMAGSVPAIGTDWIVAGTGDFNHDGMVDYYWRDTVLGINRIWFMEGLTRTGFERTLRMKDTRWQVGAICDLNNDGYADITWRHSELPRTRAWIMMDAMQIDGGALPLIQHPWFIAGCGDFDGDGNDDLLWRNAVTGQNRIWFMKGKTRVGSGSINIASINFRVGGVGDFTNDRKADIIFHDDVAGRTLLWEMDGLMRVSGKALKLQNPAFTGTAIGDWGGDGKLDLFWRNLANGKNQIWNMNGSVRMSIDSVVTMSPDFSPVP